MKCSESAQELFKALKPDQKSDDIVSLPRSHALSGQETSPKSCLRKNSSGSKSFKRVSVKEESPTFHKKSANTNGSLYRKYSHESGNAKNESSVSPSSCIATRHMDTFQMASDHDPEGVPHLEKQEKIESGELTGHHAQGSISIRP